MAHGGLGPCQALGTGQKHVLAGEGLGQLGADHAHVARDVTEGQRQHRHDGRLGHGPGEVVRAALHHQRAPAQLEAHPVLQKHRVHKGGYGNENHDKHVDELILPAVLEHGGNHAEDHAQGHGEHQRQQIHIQRGGDLAGQVLLHRHQERAHRGAEAPVELREHILEENAVLHNNRVIIAPGCPHVLQLLGIPARHRHNRVGQHPYQNKQHRHDDEQTHDEQPDTFAYVLQHR